jgi:diguanylate cyclase (GGDEF)-like protein
MDNLKSEISNLKSEPVNILLVDDRPENLLALEAVLSRLGHNLVRANSGAEALRCVLNHDFAVILLDVLMPEMDGFETAALIRERERSRHTPIIFLTAIDKSAEHVARGYALGAVDYIFKPFVPEILCTKITVFVDLYKMGHALERSEAALRELNARLELESRELSILVMTDELSSLYNRRGFLTFARQTQMLCARLAKKAWLLFADMDGLKQINDTLGHAEGDRALIEMARIFRETFRASDIISRWGGDEFAVIAVETSEASGENLIARLQTNIAAFNAAGRHPFKLSLSAGVVACDRFPGCSIEELVALADASMYAHKRSKNQAS